LSETNLDGADLNQATVWSTKFIDVDLRLAKGLGTVIHEGPSTIGIDTIYRSQGKIPVSFLRGAGVPDSFLNLMHSLIITPMSYHTCFISYASQDQAFAERLYTDLQRNRVRCWFAPEDLKIGDKIRHRIDESIRQYDKLLLVLSEHAVKSEWV